MGNARKSHLVMLYLVVIFPPLLGWAPENGIMPEELLWVFDLLCVLSFVIVGTDVRIHGREMLWPGKWMVAAFLSTWLLSLGMNQTSLYAALLMLRFPAGGYLFFWSVLNMEMAPRDERRLLKAIYAIFLLQIPLAGVKYVTIGFGETPLSLIGHAVTAYVSLVGISFCLAYYLHHRASWVFLLLCLGFAFVSVAGGKRATALLLPVVFALQLCAARRFRVAAMRAVLVAVVAGLPATYLMLRLIPTLNPEREAWGTFDPAYAINYAIHYEDGEMDGRPSGRLSATIGVFNLLSAAGVPTALVGYGPGYLVSSRFAPLDSGTLRERSGIEYGYNGLNWMALQVGYLGAFICFGLYVQVLRAAWYCYVREHDTFWRSFAFAMVTSCLIVSCIGYWYSDVYNMKEVYIPFWALAAVLYRRAWQYSRRMRPIPRRAENSLRSLCPMRCISVHHRRDIAYEKI